MFRPPLHTPPRSLSLTRALSFSPSQGPHPQDHSDHTTHHTPQCTGRLALGPCPGRVLRVVVLVIAITTLSLADLYITLSMLTSGGMAEENPIARAVIQSGSPALLTAWKLLTVAPAVFLFLVYRRRIAAETGAWIGTLLLAGVMVHWTLYIQQTDSISANLHLLQAGIDPRWVSL